MNVVVVGSLMNVVVVRNLTNVVVVGSLMNVAVVGSLMNVVVVGSLMDVVVVGSLMIRGLAGVQSNMYGSGFCVAVSRIVLFVLFYIFMFSTLLIAVFAKHQVTVQPPPHLGY